MNKIASLILLPLILLFSCSNSDSIIELDTAQSMCITGKGPGQNAAINPYTGQKSIASIKNLGKTNFSVRIENNQNLISELTLNTRESKKFVLNKGDVLYLDNKVPGKAKVTFSRFK